MIDGKWDKTDVRDPDSNGSSSSNTGHNYAPAIFPGNAQDWPSSDGRPWAQNLPKLTLSWVILDVSEGCAMRGRRTSVDIRQPQTWLTAA